MIDYVLFYCDLPFIQMNADGWSYDEPSTLIGIIALFYFRSYLGRKTIKGNLAGSRHLFTENKKNPFMDCFMQLGT